MGKIHSGVRYRIVILAGILLFGFVEASPVPAKKGIDPPQSILFIGNSFTYYNNSLHNHLRALMQAGGHPVGTMRSVTISGARLAAHAPALEAQLAANPWDAVILQGNSMEAIEQAEVGEFDAAIRRYSKAIVSSGADPVLFMTWARTHLPAQTDILDAAYTAIGNETGAFVVPAGLAFKAASDTYPDISLRTADRRHPTLAGTCLAACTFYAALFHESPVGSAYTAGLDPDVAASLQETAWQTIRGYYRW